MQFAHEKYHQVRIRRDVYEAILLGILFIIVVTICLWKLFEVHVYIDGIFEDGSARIIITTCRPLAICRLG